MRTTFQSPRFLLPLVVALALGTFALAQDVDGESVYNSNCAACHQGNGQGIPSAFPPLAGHIPDILAAENGRTFLIDVLLYGLQGEITVMGTNYNGVMPAWNQLTDEQLAAVLTYISTAWDNEPPEDFEPFTAEEVAEQRGQDLSPSDVLELREALELGSEAAE